MSAAMTLEICVDALAGLDAAIMAGADRVELCSALALGGLTPSAGLMNAASLVSLPVRAMIRPRQGDFVYSTREVELMCYDIDCVRQHRLEGIVIGANLPSGDLDERALSRLVSVAKNTGLSVTLHRAFDLVSAPLDALAFALELGIDAILTSGGAVTAAKGVANIKALVRAANERVEILAGSGISASNVADLVHRSGVRAIHASCGATSPVAQGKPVELGFIRPSQRLTDPHAVRALRHNINLIQRATG